MHLERRAAPLRGHCPAPAVRPGRPTPPEPPGQQPGPGASCGGACPGSAARVQAERPGSDATPDDRGLHAGRKLVSKPCGASGDGGVSHGTGPSSSKLQLPGTRDWEPSGRTPALERDSPTHSGQLRSADAAWGARGFLEQSTPASPARRRPRGTSLHPKRSPRCGRHRLNPRADGAGRLSPCSAGLSLSACRAQAHTGVERT